MLCIARPFTLSRRAWVPVLLLLFVVVLVRTAWVCDDAFISLRTVDHFVNGAGLVWNPAERVQAFTHPLWLFVVAAVYAVTRDPYFTPLALSIACSAGAVALLGTRVARSTAGAGLAIAIVTLSKAFVDYSTSGLENALTYVLLAWMLAELWRPEAPPGVSGRACFAAGLLVVNRLDLAVLVAPPLCVHLLTHRRRGLVRGLMLASAPLLLWELFSLIYFGYPFPNTAYAKLSTFIPQAELHAQGLLYFRDSFARDPLTLTTIAAGVVVGSMTWGARALSFGIVLYLLYVLRIGGDFMSGRFFSAPLVAAAAIVAVQPALQRARVAVPAFVLALAAGLLAPAPTILSDGYYSRTEIPASGIADERGVYYGDFGLLRKRHEWQPPRMALSPRYADVIASGRGVLVADFIGVQGYLAGRRVHIIDWLALPDPLLSRLPARRPWRIGHFARALPEGYFDSVRFNDNRIVDPDLAAYYDRVRLITRGSLWDRARLRTIVNMNLGRYDHFLERYVARMPE